MSDMTPIKDAEDLLARIIRLSTEADWSESELREAFLAEGINPSTFLDSVRAKMKDLIRESPYYWRNHARDLRSRLQSTILAANRRRTEKLPRKELIGNIEAALARMPPAAAELISVEHRNFQDCTEEDLESILIELECIEKLHGNNSDE